MAIFAAVREAIAHRVAEAGADAVHQLRYQAERADGLGSHPGHPQQTLEVLRLLLIRLDQDAVEATGIQLPQPHLVMLRQMQFLQVFDMAEQPIGRLLRQRCRYAASLGALPSHHVQRRFPAIAANGGVRLAHKILQDAIGPMIAAGIPRVLIHALLDHRPVSQPIEEKAVLVDLIAILKRCAVHLGRHPTGKDKVFWVHLQLRAETQDLFRGPSRCCSLASRHIEPRLPLQALKSLLQSAASRGGHPTGMPVEAQHATQRLEPEGVRKPPQHLRGVELLQDHQSDLPCQVGHPPEEPARRPSVVQRQVGRSRLHHNPRNRCSGPILPQIAPLSNEGGSHILAIQLLHRAHWRLIRNGDGHFLRKEVGAW